MAPLAGQHFDGRYISRLISLRDFHPAQGCLEPWHAPRVWRNALHRAQPPERRHVHRLDRLARALDDHAAAEPLPVQEDYHHAGAEPPQLGGAGAAASGSFMHNEQAAPSNSSHALQQHPQAPQEEIDSAAGTVPEHLAANSCATTQVVPPPSSQPAFDVPWGLGSVFMVMSVWLLAFWLNCWLLEFGLEMWSGVTSSQLSNRGRALYHVLLDCANLAVTTGILVTLLRPHRPFDLPWLRPRLRPWSRWLPVLAAVAAFPALNWLAAHSAGWFPVEGGEVWDVEQVVAAGDAVTNGMYFLLLMVLAPVWEELIFRGFLLASLTKHMPLPWAVLASSIAFAMAHFSWQRGAALLALGLLLGGLFARSHNLTHSIALHSLWNLCIFCQLVRQGM